MQLPESVAELIATVAADREHGASWLARAALQVVGACARASAELDRTCFLERIDRCASDLIAARPGMTPVAGWLRRLLQELRAEPMSDGSTEALVARTVRLVEDFVAQSEHAGQQVAEAAAARLPRASVIFSGSYSQTVLAACQLADRAGKLRKVLVSGSFEGDGHRYGRELVQSLAARGIPAELVFDAALAERIPEADCIWLGADSVFRDGSVFNGVPSLHLARAATEAGKPVEILCEAAKIDDWTPLDQIPPSGNVDRVPSELIDLILTERGVWDPAESLVAGIATALVDRQETLAVLESAAGGRICDLLSNRPGSSAWFEGGAVVYSNASKQELAAISPDELARVGSVSPEAAHLLAEGAARRFKTTWGIGETGIAGPQTGRRSTKSSGLVYLALRGPGDARRAVEIQTGSNRRLKNKHAFAVAALGLLLAELERHQELKSRMDEGAG